MLKFKGVKFKGRWVELIESEWYKNSHWYNTNKNLFESQGGIKKVFYRPAEELILVYCTTQWYAIKFQQIVENGKLE